MVIYICLMSIFFFKCLLKYINEKKESKKVIQELQEACPINLFVYKVGVILSFSFHELVKVTIYFILFFVVIIV